VKECVLSATGKALRPFRPSLAMFFSDHSVELTYDVHTQCDHHCEYITYDLPDMVLVSLWLAEEICTTSTRSAVKSSLSNNRSASTSAPEGLSELKSTCS